MCWELWRGQNEAWPGCTVLDNEISTAHYHTHSKDMMGEEVEHYCSRDHLKGPGLESVRESLGSSVYERVQVQWEATEDVTLMSFNPTYGWLTSITDGAAGRLSSNITCMYVWRHVQIHSDGWGIWNNSNQGNMTHLHFSMVPFSRAYSTHTYVCI